MSDRTDRPSGGWARLTAHMEPAVFFGSAAVVIVFVAFGGLATDTAASLFNSTQVGVSRYFGWYYVLAVTGFLLVALALLLSPARYIRLGGDGARPDFSRIGWFGMLFAAGMGIGLVYFGVAEPLLHYDNPLREEPRSFGAIRESMRLTYFHWGLHAWGIYIVFALAIAHAHFNRGLPLAPRVVLEPLIGERYKGWIGHVVDIMCTVGTLLGVATSLGLGAMQINTSLATFFGWPESLLVQVLLIAGITVLATISVVSGVKNGVQVLSRTNLYLMAALIAFVLITGPTLYVAELFVSSLGAYLQKLPQMSLYLDPGADSEWQTTWTLFYWGWWISWSPFVAIFVARISRGRTIREFILAVLLVPVLVTFLWLSVFGGTAIEMQTAEGGADLIAAVNENQSASLQALLAELPWPTITTIFATVVILLFFVTSSDSGSLVDDMVTSGGDPDPPVAQRVFWAVAEGAVAATLLLLGGLTAIRNAAISLGLPMSLLLIASCIALWRTVHGDAKRRKREREQEAEKAAS